ncbi:MAG: hypothetical protein QXW39_09675 [Candidatus Bathyarchaeia archaeon]
MNPMAIVKERALFCIPLNKKNFPDILARIVRIPLVTARPAISLLPLKSEEAMIIKENIPINIPMAMCTIISGTENMGSIMKPIGGLGSEELIAGANRFIHIPRINCIARRKS